MPRHSREKHWIHEWKTMVWWRSRETQSRPRDWAESLKQGYGWRLSTKLRARWPPSALIVVCSDPSASLA